MTNYFFKDIDLNNLLYSDITNTGNSTGYIFLDSGIYKDFNTVFNALDVSYASYPLTNFLVENYTPLYGVLGTYDLGEIFQLNPSGSATITKYYSISVSGEVVLSSYQMNSIYYSYNSGINFNSSLQPTAPGYGCTVAISDVTSNFNAILCEQYSSVAVPVVTPDDPQTNLYYSNNGGQSWILSNSGSNYWNQADISGPYAVAFAGYNPGSYNIFYSTDFGQNWTQSNTSFTGVNYLISISISGQNALVSGYLTNGPNVVYYSQDGGINWNIPNLIPTTISYISISGLNAIAGSGYYNSQPIYYSQDGGINWYSSNSVSRYWTPVSISGLNAIAVSVIEGFPQQGTIYYSTDGGVNWNESNLTNQPAFSAISISGLKAVAVSLYDATILSYSSDGGQTWSS